MLIDKTQRHVDVIFVNTYVYQVCQLFLCIYHENNVLNE